MVVVVVVVSSVVVVVLVEYALDVSGGFLLEVRFVEEDGGAHGEVELFEHDADEFGVGFFPEVWSGGAAQLGLT